ncbi:hypothetical protein FE257_000286 [Aspergillus nanangensis]|uniref:Ferric oxidoreductase domain-containing protein n=1 Tax=Aspergillus nanangensis TaxID=2582783 RepID=A0AAD4CZ36_ASPNN|nr:hypothetical protein FE257_000286 [Aspergillus nanangensis]
MASSSWPWHFVSVSPEQAQQRRDLLDLRGYYAQISVLFAIVIIRLYSGHEPAQKTPSRKKQKSWWDSPPFAGWMETRRQYAVTLIWFTWLLALSMWKTGDDYLHLTRALGHVSLSQLPFQTLMSPVYYISVSKPASPSVVSILTSISQPMLSPYHRLFGRIVLSPLLVGHAALYLAFFAQSDHPDFSSLLVKRLQDDDVQCGILAISVVVSVLLFVRPVGNPYWLRLWTSTSIRSRREAFYTVHLSLVAGLCLVAYYHVAQAQTFVLQALAAFVVNAGCCWVCAR